VISGGRRKEHVMLRHLVRVLPVVSLVALIASPASATPVTYNFEAPNFTGGQLTPLVNVAPNIGPGTFLTTFAGSPTGNGFGVAAGFPSPLFSGQFLVELGGAVADTLLLTFNTPIFYLQVDFGLNVLAAAPAGSLSLVTPVGSTSQVSAAVGGPFQGGTLSFSSAVPFVTAQLSAFNAAGLQVFYAIDDLVLDAEVVAPIPEPVTSVLVLTGLGLMARKRLRNQRQS
jgi:hypothetical protein